ncbi:MAG: cytochrome c oxidase subunit 3 [Phycisphaeraceae bacterium]|nr:cytochrome c oxidase subunit 3 [Phycisphaeraceae bacterium]
MSSIPSQNASKPLWARYTHASHFRTAAEEFDACKLGFWLFLTTEVLLFGGIFCAYFIFRTLYPGAWKEGSQLLDWRFGGLNTAVLLISSYTMAASIYCFQKGYTRRAQWNLIITLICGAAFLFIKLAYEYIPKWSVGKRPGALFDYPFATDPHLPLWWSVYYSGTAIHAAHVIIGMVLIARVLYRSYKGHYGPTHYTMVEITGLYWHLVDLIWIFLFPLLYLIH